MKGTKTVFKFFTIVQYRQEEAYLSAMHGRGWKLSHVTFPGFYHFDRCEPEEVSYRLDYNPDGIRDKAGYVQIFSDCGWDYLLDFTGYSYFRKKCAPGEGREEIFSDDSSRLDMMRRVMRHRGRTLIILFAGIILPQFFTQTVGFGGGSEVQDVLSLIYLILTMAYLALFGVMAWQFYQYEKRLSTECPGAKGKYVGLFLLLLTLAVATGTFFYYTKRSVYSVFHEADGFTVEAKQLNRPVVLEYDLKKDSRIAVRHENDGGGLHIQVETESGEPLFCGNCDFTLEIPKDGRYRITCSGRRAKGTVRLTIQ